jgi:hypothetical protein
MGTKDPQFFCKLEIVPSIGGGGGKTTMNNRKSFA